MDDYGASTYGDRIADIYDSLYSDVPFSGDPVRTASFLRDLSGSGPALELGIGTGRVALPLRETGVEVHGIDASEAMVAQLRAKPGGADVPVTIGDFSAFSLQARSGSCTWSSTRSSRCHRPRTRCRASTRSAAI